MSSKSSKTYRAATGTVGDQGCHGVDLEKFEGRLAVQVSQAEKVDTRFSLNVSCDEDGSNWVLFHAARVVGNSGEGKKWNAWIVLEDDELEDKLKLLGWTDLLPRAQSGEFEEVGETEFELIEQNQGVVASPATSLDVPIGPPVEMTPTDVVDQMGPTQPMTDEIVSLLARTREPLKASPPPLPAPDSAPKAVPEVVLPQILPGPALPSFQVPNKASGPAVTSAKPSLPDMKVTLFATPPLEAMQNGNKGMAVRFKVENGLILVPIRDEGQDQSGQQLYATFMVGDGRCTTRSSFALRKKASKKDYGEYTLKFVSEHDWECVANLFRDGDYGVILSEEMKPDIPSVSAAARAEVAPQVRELFDDTKADAVQRDGRKDEKMMEEARPRQNGRAESDNPTIAERRPKGKTLVLVGKDGTKHFLDSEEAMYTVGREEDNNIVLDGMSVSSRHAVIKYDSQLDGWYLWDLDSSNGTKINGNHLEGNRPFRFEADDELSFGGVMFAVKDVTTAARRVVLPRSNTAIVRQPKKRQDKDARLFGSGPNDMRPVTLDRDRDEEVKKLGWLFRLVVAIVLGSGIWLKSHDLLYTAIAIVLGVSMVSTWLIDKMVKSSVGRKLAENLLDEDTKLWDLVPGWVKVMAALVAALAIVLGVAYLGDKYDIAKRLRGAPQVTVVEDPKPVADPKPVQAVVQPPPQQPAAPTYTTIDQCVKLGHKTQALACCAKADPSVVVACNGAVVGLPE